MTSRIQIKIIGKNPDYFLKELIKKKELDQMLSNSTISDNQIKERII